MPRMFVLTLLLVSCLAHASASASDAPIRLAIGDKSAPNIIQGINAIYQDLFARVGRSVELVELPLKRSEKMLLSGGDLDGESVRIPEFSDRVPNLVMVKEPAAVSEFVAYSADATLKVDTVQALTSGRYSIAYPGGNLMLSNLFKRLRDRLAVVEVWSIHQGLALAESKQWICFLM